MYHHHMLAVYVSMGAGLFAAFAGMLYAVFAKHNDTDA